MQLLRTIAVVLAAILLVPAGSHVASMASKLKLDAGQYLAAQRVYDGWNLFGIPTVLLALCMIVLGVWAYHAGKPYGLVFAAIVCLAADQAIFWLFTFPANAATADWTSLPDNWQTLRTQWEWSHAGGALATLAMFVSLVLDLARS